jgi:predicted oxidoreductase
VVVNQIELSLPQSELITEGLDANRDPSRRLRPEYTGAAGTLDYCRLHDIQVQAYSPLGRLINPPADAPQSIKQTVQMLDQIARKRNVAPSAVAHAWLLRHPAGIETITGANNPQHIIENCAALKVNLSRPEWYGLMTAASGATMSKAL